jgi:hypothetical protein
MHKLPRRAALAAPLLLLARPAAAARLHPDIEGHLTLTADGPNQAALRCEGIDGTVHVPLGRARIAAILPVADRDIACVAFADDPPSGDGDLDLVALIGWDGAALRVLGLDVLHWTGLDGSLLNCRIAGIGDRTRLRLAREATGPSAQPRRWEQWTDYWQWTNAAPLRDTPVRPPPSGTWQARLAQARGRAERFLAVPRQEVSDMCRTVSGFSTLFG